MTDLPVIIGGLALVTYLPRLLPFYLVDRWKLPKVVQGILEQIPYAALGALILPGVLEPFPGQPLVPLAGLGAALLVSVLRGGLVLSVLAAVAVVFLLR